jgi:hypothetical protein
MTKVTVHSTLFQPAVKIGPRPTFPPPSGPAAQQPTGGPPKRPARAPRLGRKLTQQPLEAAAVHSRSICTGVIRRPSATFGGIKDLCSRFPLKTLEHSFFSLSRSTPTAVAAVRWPGGRPLPATATERRPPQAAGGTHLFFSSVLSLPPLLFPSPQEQTEPGMCRPWRPEKKTVAAPPRALSPVSAFPTRESAPPSRGCTAVPSGPKPTRR